MKKQFSKKWIKSKQPRKQRKYRANAPLHTKHKFISANLSKELRKRYGKRSFPLKKGDKIKIMIGEFKKKTGKIEIVNLKKSRVSIEGIQRTKKDGSKVNVWFNPSNLQIQELNLEDKKRIKAIQRKSGKEGKEIIQEDKKSAKEEIKTEKKQEEKGK